MRLISNIASSPVWVLVPTMVVACMVGLVVAGYDPLTFDPALVKQAQAAQTANLKTRDAEKEEKSSGESVAVGKPAPADAVQTASAPSANLKLADGTWTGYAACGQGNGDGWKPYYVAVTIVVKDGKVARISNVEGSSKSDAGSMLSWDAGENQMYLDWASSGRAGVSGVVSQMNSAFSAGKTVSGVDTVSGATYSSVAIYNAYVAAVNKSAKAAGSQAKVKAKTKTDSKSKGRSKAKPKPAKKIKDDAGAGMGVATFADGEWVGYAPCGKGNDEGWSSYYVAVTVSVANGKVTGVKSVAGSSTGDVGSEALNWKESENKAYLEWAANGRTRSGAFYAGVLNQIESAIAAGAQPAGIDAVSGATYSSEAILRAYYAALKKSAAAAGSSVDEPSDHSGASGDSGADSGGSASSEIPSGSGSAGDDPVADEPASDDPEPADILVDGVYSGHALCRDLDSPKAYSPYYIIVEIEVAGGKVASIANVYADSEGVIDGVHRYDSGENSTYLDFAINGVGKRVKGMKAKMQERLDSGADPTAVDTVSGATWSSKSIIEAYNAAVATAPKVEEGEQQDA